MNTRTNGLAIRAAAGSATLALLLASSGCGDEDTPAGAPQKTVASASSTVADEAAPEVVERLYDVGGHELFLSCEGSGSPTVVYMHGSIEDPSTVAHQAGAGFSSLLAPDYRVCVYDRRNVGDSDSVDAVQLPEDAVSDLHTLLDVAGVEPPYVLVGASFGGMLAYLYANQHPDQVIGMVLLDAMFPDELSLEHLFAPADRYEAFDQTDETEGLERISHYKCITAGQRFIGKEPRIPVTYLASDTEGYEDNDFGIPAYDKRILEVQAAYVDRFAPGKLIRVDAPHFMEQVIPETIADEVGGVIGARK